MQPSKWNPSSLAEDELAAVMDFLKEARTAVEPYPLPRVRKREKPHEPHSEDSERTPILNRTMSAR